MYEWMYDLVTSGLPMIEWAQEFRTPLLDSLFRAGTFLGEADFFLLLVPFFYWAVDKRFGLKLAYLLVFSLTVNLALKSLFRLPRPPLEFRLVSESTYGFPSGHATNAVAMWGYLGRFLSRLGRWVWPVIGVLIFLQASSRIYLGIHYPADVVGGLISGGLILWIWVSQEDRLTRWAGSLSLGQVVAGSVALAALMLFVTRGEDGYPVEDAATLAGVIVGANVGIFYEARRVGFSAMGGWAQRLARLAVGLVILAVVREGLALLFGVILPDFEQILWLERTLRFIRYAVVGLTLTWWIPALFVRVGLAPKMQSI